MNIPEQKEGTFFDHWARYNDYSDEWVIQYLAWELHPILIGDAPTWRTFCHIGIAGCSFATKSKEEADAYNERMGWYIHNHQPSI